MLSMKQFAGVLAAVILLACGSVAQATSFTFNPQPNTPGAFPDITFSLSNLSYTGGVLTACGQATQLRTSAIAFENLVDSGCGVDGFSLNATFTAGVFNSGTVTVKAGDPTHPTPPGGIPSGSTIFQAQITAFDFTPCFNGAPNACSTNEGIVSANPLGYNHASIDPNGIAATLDFLLKVTSDPFNLGFNVGAPAGIQIATDNVFTSSFTQSFLSRTASSTNDLFHQAVVPEPSGLLLLGTGVALLFRRRLARCVTRKVA